MEHPLEGTWPVRVAYDVAKKLLNDDKSISVEISTHPDSGEYKIQSPGATEDLTWVVDHTTDDGMMVSGTINDTYGFVITDGTRLSGKSRVLGIIYFLVPPVGEDDPGFWEAEGEGNGYRRPFLEL